MRFDTKLTFNKLVGHVEATRKFSEKGGPLGRKTTHMAQPPKKWEDFYAFPVKSEVEIKIQKEGR